jgi:hypothetical protein
MTTIVTPRHSRGSSYTGKALFCWLRLKALGTFLHLQRRFSPPAPSRTVSKLKIESELVRKGTDTGGGCVPSLPKPFAFYENRLCCFENIIRRILGKVQLAFLLTAKAFLNYKNGTDHRLGEPSH